MTRLVPSPAAAGRCAGIITRATIPAPPHRKPRRAARARAEAGADAAAPATQDSPAAAADPDDDDDLYSVGPIAGLSLDYVAPSVSSGRSRSPDGGDGA